MVNRGTLGPRRWWYVTNTPHHGSDERRSIDPEPIPPTAPEPDCPRPQLFRYHSSGYRKIRTRDPGDNTAMQVERTFIEVVSRRVVIELPESFVNHRVEIIALTVDEEAGKPRRPHADIVGKVQIHGDIFTSAPETDWHPGQ
jgi:hypothetical protein